MTDISRIESGDDRVYNKCAEILVDHGVPNDGNMTHHLTQLLSSAELTVGNPPANELHEIYLHEISGGLLLLRDQFERFPATGLATVRKQLLRAVDEGLRGERFGPVTAPREVAYAGRDNPPVWAANPDDLPVEDYPDIDELLRDSEFNTGIYSPYADSQTSKEQPTQTRPDEPATPQSPAESVDSMGAPTRGFASRESDDDTEASETGPDSEIEQLQIILENRVEKPDITEAELAHTIEQCCLPSATVVDEDMPGKSTVDELREGYSDDAILAAKNALFGYPDEYLEAEKIDYLDSTTQWYILSWLVHGSETIDYDDGYRLGLAIGVDIDEIKRSAKIWGEESGDIQLKTHDDRVQDITLPPEERLDRAPVDPEAMSYQTALDAVHAAMHVYEKQGEDVAIDWLKERNFESDLVFKGTLKALLQVLPQNSSECEAARDLALGQVHDALSLEFTPADFTDDSKDTLERSNLGDH